MAKVVSHVNEMAEQKTDSTVRSGQDWPRASFVRPCVLHVSVARPRNLHGLGQHIRCAQPSWQVGMARGCTRRAIGRRVASTPRLTCVKVQTSFAPKTNKFSFPPHASLSPPRPAVPRSCIRAHAPGGRGAVFVAPPLRPVTSRFLIHFSRRYA